jgi:hypothetical protein
MNARPFTADATQVCCDSGVKREAVSGVGKWLARSLPFHNIFFPQRLLEPPPDR